MGKIKKNQSLFWAKFNDNNDFVIMNSKVSYVSNDFICFKSGDLIHQSRVFNTSDESLADIKALIGQTVYCGHYDNESHKITVHTYVIGQTGVPSFFSLTYEDAWEIATQAAKKYLESRSEYISQEVSKASKRLAFWQKEYVKLQKIMERLKL